MGQLFEETAKVTSYIAKENSQTNTPIMKQYYSNDTSQPRQTIIIQQSSNGIGTAGFVLALLGLLLCWLPVINWILWLLGFVFSLCGIFKRHKGLAIVGLMISFIGAIIMICILGAIAAMIAIL